MASLNDHENRIKKIETGVMQIQSFSKTLTVNQGQWTDTGIILPTGVYIFDIKVNTSQHGGSQWYEFYSGICSSYNSNINSDNITEIPLTNAGHAPNSRFITFGFKRVPDNTGKQCFVISANENFNNCPIYFNFRKVL